jgi:hypothetical protein
MVLRFWGFAVAVALLSGGAQATAQGRRDGQPPSPRGAGPRALLYGFALECGECRWTRDPGEPRDIWQYADLPHVAAVTDGGAAARAGVQVGDTLVAVDGVSILTPDGGRRLSLVRLGDRVTFTLRRAGQVISRVLVVGPPMPPPRSGDAFRYSGQIGAVPVRISGDAPLVVSTDSTGALLIRTPGATIRIQPQGASEVPKRP